MRVLAMLHLYKPAHQAGAEMMAHNMFRRLVEAGHEVNVQLSLQHEQIPEPYEIDGIKVWPYRSKGDPFRFLGEADVVVTHLENTPRATILTLQTGTPLVILQHNTFEICKHWVRPHALCVYNSEWMRRDYETWFAAHSTFTPPGMVVHPPVFASEYATTPGDRVTLVNLYEPKGGKVFWQLAERMPDVQFLGVRGAYGIQETGDLPNVEVIAHTPNARDDIYGRTRILLMPSSYESWGRTSVEAAASGIPTVATPTPGLREALGDAGTFVQDRNDLGEWEAGIRSLLDGRRWRAASRKALARSAELDPTRELDAWVATMEEVARSGASRRRISA